MFSKVPKKPDHTYLPRHVGSAPTYIQHSTYLQYLPRYIGTDPYTVVIRYLQSRYAVSADLRYQIPT